MAIVLPDLPYPKDALAPYLSAETLEFHHDKHHAAYVAKANELLAGSGKEDMDLEELVKTAEGPLFNQVGQVWNHNFYWLSMMPNGGGAPHGDLAKAIDRDFGSFEDFKKEFADAGATQFGSGWAWLVLENGMLKVTKTPNAENPLKHGQTPILTMDVWEHAYYIDYRNQRPKYIEAFLNNLVCWHFAADNYEKAV